jgi:hypothetical protein
MVKLDIIYIETVLTYKLKLEQSRYILEGDHIMRQLVVEVHELFIPKVFIGHLLQT